MIQYNRSGLKIKDEGISKVKSSKKGACLMLFFITIIIIFLLF